MILFFSGLVCGVLDFLSFWLFGIVRGIFTFDHNFLKDYRLDICLWKHIDIFNTERLKILIIEFLSNYFSYCFSCIFIIVNFFLLGNKYFFLNFKY